MTDDAAATGPVTLHPDVVNAMAASLKATPTATNPLYSPTHMMSMPRISRLAIHAASPQVLQGAPPVTKSVTVDMGELDSIGSYESSGSLDPRTGMLRLPQARLEVCGSAMVTLGPTPTTATLKWIPQRDFKAVRLLIPSGEDTGTYISNIIVGNRPIYLGSGNEPAEDFSELSTAGQVDFPVCKVGITIAATLSNTTLGAATNFYTALLGYVTDGKATEPLRGYLRRMAIPPQVVAAGASYTYGLNPQDAFKVRKFVVENGAAPGFIISQAQIGNEPQLLSGDPIPAQAFADRAQDVWVDWDRCKTGQQIFLTVTNITGAAATFQGALLGDVDESTAF